MAWALATCVPSKNANPSAVLAVALRALGVIDAAISLATSFTSEAPASLSANDLRPCARVTDYLRRLYARILDRADQFSLSLQKSGDNPPQPGEIYEESDLIFFAAVHHVKLAVNGGEKQEPLSPQSRLQRLQCALFLLEALLLSPEDAGGEQAGVCELPETKAVLATKWISAVSNQLVFWERHLAPSSCVNHSLLENRSGSFPSPPVRTTRGFAAPT
jgi:hypothetical protein